MAKGDKENGKQKNDAKTLAIASYDRFINRELSWLDFNERVLQEARDSETPLLERLSFLAITQSNLDEFIMVRIASLKDQIKARDFTREVSGLTAADQLEKISERMHKFAQKQYNTYNRQLLPRLEKEGIFILPRHRLVSEQISFAHSYFRTTLYPILTPMAVDQGRPFPLIPNRSQNIAVLLERDDEEDNELHFATVQIPSGLPRLVKLPVEQFSKVNGLEERGTHCYILLEELINAYLGEVFHGLRIMARCMYRIIRNAVMDFDEEDTPDLLTEIEKQLRQRQWGEVINLSVREDVSPKLLNTLIELTHVAEEDIYHLSGPLDLTFMGKLSRAAELRYRKDLLYPAYTPQVPAMLAGRENTDMFATIAEQDLLISMPYESFDPVTEFVKQAARDPKVLAIKQTLYRVSGQSPIIQYLEEAATNGKQVLVLLELKARFDEENNIQWAKKLEQAGCHVIYGLVGLKTHSKITLVVREEETGIRRYLHLGTGNYNDSTARIYTDLGLFTAAESYGTDATEFFNMISGYSEPLGWNRLTMAPYWLRRRFLDLIQREIENAKVGKEAWIHAKLNSLVDQEIIERLYMASAAGVKIRLIVRGICCLKAGVTGLSENIEVKSIIGRYLEHSRVYIFANDGKREIYLSSADWMPRNLDRRVELLFPVEDDECGRRVEEIMELQFADTERSHILQADGSYKKADRRGRAILDSHRRQEELAIARAGQSEGSEYERLLRPLEPFSVKVSLQQDELGEMLDD
ncbi:MAG: RNA degradosome polyphosphate kinase [Clostridia bacterium]|nr:RNA degradosome polyphosphate kinase [Clostridia bacterium]